MVALQVKLVIEEHPKNAVPPSEVTPDGKSMLVNAEQFLKQRTETDVIASPKSNDSITLKFSKAAVLSNRAPCPSEPLVKYSAPGIKL